MGKVFSATSSKFRFQGTRFTTFLRERVLEIHNLALREMLEFMALNTPNFTGETQATFRQFRDYLSTQGLEVQLKDFTDTERVNSYGQTLQRRWRTKAKIANLYNAGFTTAAGANSVFKVTITRQGFAFKVFFESGSPVFDLRELSNGIPNPLLPLFNDAKKIYKDFLDAAFEQLFSPEDFGKSLVDYFNRASIRST